MADQSRQGEHGFTLIELLIAVLVSGLILSALTTAFITTIRGTKDLHDRFVQSHDAQLLAAYFPSDVESADPNLGVSTSGSAWSPCPAASNPGASVPNVIQMQWSETNGATTTSFAVSYRTRQVPLVAGETVRYELVRYFCSGSTVTSTVVAHNIATPAAPVISGQAITMTLTAVAAPTASTAGPYSFTFSGRMRTPVPPPPYPRVSSITRKTATPTNASSVSWRVLFDRPVMNVAAGDFTPLVTGLTGVGSPTIVLVSSSEYTVSVTTGTGSGAIALKLVDDNSITDTATPPNALGGPGVGDGDYTGQSYDIDRTYPVVSSVALAGTSPTSGPNVSWTVTFSEPVVGVVPASFNPVASGVSNGGVTVTPVSATVYTATVGSVSGSGTLRLDVVDNNVIKDNAGNPLGGPSPTDGNFSDPTNATYTINSGAPAAPSITNVQLVNNGTAGKIETGDQVVITFSAPIKVSTFCAAWSGDGNNQSITNGNDVTVKVADGGAADTLTVTTTSSACSGGFHFGTLALNADYVTADTTYVGNGGSNASTINWDATNHKLTITLGKDTPSGNAKTGVAASLPKYTVDAAVTDPYNQPVTPNYATAGSNQRF